MGWGRSARFGALVYLAALMPLPALAEEGALTVQQLLAEEDQALVGQLAGWTRRAFAVPDELRLDGPLREAATKMAQDHVARVTQLLKVWIAEERTASGAPHLRGGALSQPVFRRLLNEMAVWWIDSTGPAYDAAWLKAALAPSACSVIPPTTFAQRIAMVQTAPVESRAALLAGEQELLSRWGTRRQSLAARPSPADFEAPDRAIGQLRAGIPVKVEPMAPFLASRIFDRGRKPGKPDRWEQCAKSQWWLASQLADGKTGQAQALALYRFSTLFDAQEFVPVGVLQSKEQQSYPPAAAYFNVEGITTVEVQSDANGAFVQARVVSRRIAVPGVRDNPPVAFETLLDAAALAIAAKGSYADGKGTLHRRDFDWRLK